MLTLGMAIKFFQDCGLFIYPSLLIMALGVSIAIERYLFLARARRDNRRLWEQAQPLLQQAQWKDAQGLAAQTKELLDVGALLFASAAEAAVFSREVALALRGKEAE